MLLFSTIATRVYLAEHERLTSLLDSATSARHQMDAHVVDAESAIGWLTDMRRLWWSWAMQVSRSCA